MDEVFRALADPSRRALLDALHARGGQSLRELGEGLEMSRQAVAKHLGVLETAGLVVTSWQGREKHHHLNAAPINDEVEISEAAKLADKLGDVPEIRQDRVQQIRAQIAEGTYETQEKLDIAVSRLLDEIG